MNIKKADRKVFMYYIRGDFIGALFLSFTFLMQRTKKLHWWDYCLDL